MKPIINPWWVYFIDLLSDLEFVLCIFSIISIVLVIAYAIWYVMSFAGEDTDEEYLVQPFKRYTKICLVVSVVGVIVMTIIPTKETMYTMMTLEQVTPDNISAVGKTGENIIDYITEKIDQVVNGEEKE